MLSLHFRKYGDTGPSLIILHGFLGSLDNWHTLATQWSQNGLTVYSLDLRNHGKSPHTKDHSIDLMADDLFHFIREHQLDQVILLGHSMGGKVAMQCAIDHTELIKLLIVSDIAPRAYSRGAHDAVFQAIFHVALENIQNRKQAEEAMTPFLGDFGTRQFILKSLEREGDSFRWKFNIQTLYDTYDEAIRQISSDHPVLIPTHFIRGDQSLYIRDEDRKEILALFPNATLTTIKSAGHWIHADQPQAFFEEILHTIKTKYK
jgi:pimeloyl-ACP methyl ester carboxylesterase